MGYLGQKYDKGLVIQRSPEGSAFQENVDVTVDGDTEITPKVGGGIKKVNITSSGGGSAAKYVDLTGCFSDVEFDGQLVELDKQELDIEDITKEDIINQKIKFTYGEIFFQTMYDNIAADYPWTERQFAEETIPTDINSWITITYDRSYGFESSAVLILGFDDTNNKLYASFVLDDGGISWEDFYAEAGIRRGYYYEDNAAIVNISSVIETDKQYEASATFVSYVDPESGDTKSEIHLHGDGLYFNNQPIGGGEGSIYDLEDTPALTLTVHRKEESQVTGWPREFTYKIISLNTDYQSSTPLPSHYTSLKEAIDEIVESKPSKISMNCIVSNYDDDESQMDNGFNSISLWTLTGQYSYQEGNNEEISLVYTTTIMSGITVNLVIRKITTEQEDPLPLNLDYWFMIQSPEIKMYGEPVLPLVMPGE